MQAPGRSIRCGLGLDILPKATLTCGQEEVALEPEISVRPIQSHQPHVNEWNAYVGQKYLHGKRSLSGFVICVNWSFNPFAFSFLCPRSYPSAFFPFHSLSIYINYLSILQTQLYLSFNCFSSYLTHTWLLPYFLLLSANSTLFIQCFVCIWPSVYF